MRRPERRVVIPWESLAGVGLRWAQQSGNAGNGAKARQKIMSLELCPYCDYPADPLLKSLMVEEPPLRPGLPGRRYRIAIPAYVDRRGGRELAAAAQARAPQLWFGEHERPYGES